MGKLYKFTKVKRLTFKEMFINNKDEKLIKNTIEQIKNELPEFYKPIKQGGRK